MKKTHISKNEVKTNFQKLSTASPNHKKAISFIIRMAKNPILKKSRQLSKIHYWHKNFKNCKKEIFFMCWSCNINIKTSNRRKFLKFLNYVKIFTKKTNIT